MSSITMQKGFTIVEFITAAALFVIIAAPIGMLTIQGISSNRGSTEHTKATYLADEAIEAVTSIRNQNYANLINGTHGLSRGNGYWELSGTSDTYEKYTRTITIEDGLRDGSNNLVDSGGTADPNTKKVTAQVSWNFTPANQNEVSQVLYLTNWSESNTPPSNSCPEYCEEQGYGFGNCRANMNQCTSNGETYQSGGDLFCTGGGNANTCCCGGTAAPTDTPTPTSTPPPGATNTPTPSPTQIPTPPPSCTTTCQSNGYSNGICRKNNGECNANGETQLSSGNQYCTGGPNADTCCCQ